MSPYNYCVNNPIIFNDPSGMEGDNTTKTLFIDNKSGRLLGELNNFIENEKRENFSMPEEGINIRSMSAMDFYNIQSGYSSSFVDEDENGLNVYKLGPSIKIDKEQIKADLENAAKRNVTGSSYKEQLVTILFNSKTNTITSELLPDTYNTEVRAGGLTIYTLTVGEDNPQTKQAKAEWQDLVTPYNMEQGERRKAMRGSFMDSNLNVIALAHTHPEKQKSLMTGSQNTTLGGVDMRATPSENDFALMKDSGLPDFILETGRGTLDKVPVRLMAAGAKNKDDLKPMGNLSAVANNTNQFVLTVLNNYKQKW